MTCIYAIQSAAAAAASIAAASAAAALYCGCCCCCLSCVPDDKICCWFIESDSSVLFLFIHTRFIFTVLFDSIVAFTAKFLPIMHPR